MEPFAADLGAVLSNQNARWFKDAWIFIEVLQESVPALIQDILSAVNVSTAEHGWIDSLERGGDPRQTVALLVGAALDRTDEVGELARWMLKNFVKKSIPNLDFYKSRSKRLRHG